MTKSLKEQNKKKNGVYDISNIELFRKVADNIASGDSIKEACKKEGKPENFYFRFQAENLDNEEVSKLSTRARVQKSHGYFDKCERALSNLENDVYEPQKARVLFDGYLRLAAKANQGIYGDKQEVDLKVKEIPAVRIELVE